MIYLMFGIGIGMFVFGMGGMIVSIQRRSGYRFRHPISAVVGWIVVAACALSLAGDREPKSMCGEKCQCEQSKEASNEN